MNICFYTSDLPLPHLGGIERVTYNLANYFTSTGIQVFHLTSKGIKHDGLIPDNVSIETKVSFIRNYLKINQINIIIDQYGHLSYLKHPYIPYTIKIIRCDHLNIESKHTFRCLLWTFSFHRLKYSILNLLFLINTPRRHWRNVRTFRKLFRTREIDRLVLLSDRYIPIAKKKYFAQSEQLFAIPNACEESLLSVPNNLQKKKQIVWCGRIVHNPKNVLFLVELWSRLYKKTHRLGNDNNWGRY